jgi:hypothetical protein
MLTDVKGLQVNSERNSIDFVLQNSSSGDTFIIIPSLQADQFTDVRFDYEIYARTSPGGYRVLPKIPDGFLLFVHSSIGEVNIQVRAIAYKCSVSLPSNPIQFTTEFINVFNPTASNHSLLIKKL